MMYEYKIDDVIEILKKDHPLDEIPSDDNYLMAIVRYCTIQPELLVDRIMEDCNISPEDKARCISGLIWLYPLSGKVLNRIMKDYSSEISDFSLTNLSEISKMLRRTANKISQVFVNYSAESQEHLLGHDAAIASMNEQLKAHEEDIKNEEEKINTLSELKEQDTEARRELNKLTKQRENLEQWTEDGIRRQKEKIQQEIDGLIYNKKNNQGTLKKLDDELKKLKNSDVEFNNALDAFGDIMATLPKDGVE